ncbi:hypothetical protein PIB30_111847, partial [Stylosanthes scabra]|nr:hypothetical protein [Stylosanthes scabra]
MRGLPSYAEEWCAGGRVWFPRICVGWHVYAWEDGGRGSRQSSCVRGRMERDHEGRVPCICVGMYSYAWVVRDGW